MMPIIYLTLCYFAGVGIFKLAEFYQTIGIISQSYDLVQMKECIIQYGKYISVALLIILYTRVLWRFGK